VASLDRREREKAQLRAKILDAARVLFSTHGFEAVSMRKIAQAIEYSPTAIYAYFRDKEALFRELCAEDFGALAKAFHKIEAVADPVERIRRTGRAYIEFAIRNANHYRFMFMGPGDDPKRMNEQMLEKRGNPDEDGYAFFRGHVAEAMAAGRGRPELNNVELVTQTLWAAVHGVASLQIAKGDGPWVEWRPLKERTNTMVDGILRGLLK
jgi:AcrR family transcriptional regulator